MISLPHRYLLLVFAIAMQSCMGMMVTHHGKSSKSEPAYQDIYVPSGTTTPALSMGFEATYDPQLDNVIPDYKILTVAIINNSLEYLQMDPLADQWWVIDRGKSKHKAILNLRDKNPDTWARLPPRLRGIIEYPLMARIAETVTVDLLFPATIRLSEFREVVFKSASRQKIIHIVPRE